MAKLRKINPELCKSCIFMSGVVEHGCNYIGITGHSRIFKGRERTVPNGYCDKYIEGDKITGKLKGWRASDMTLIFSDKGGQVYERRYIESYYNDERFNSDS